MYKVGLVLVLLFIGRKVGARSLAMQLMYPSNCNRGITFDSHLKTLQSMIKRYFNHCYSGISDIAF